MSAEQLNIYNTVLKENNEFQKTYGTTKLNLDKSKSFDNFNGGKGSKLRSDAK